MLVVSLCGRHYFALHQRLRTHIWNPWAPAHWDWSSFLACSTCASTYRILAVELQRRWAWFLAVQLRMPWWWIYATLETLLFRISRECALGIWDSLLRVLQAALELIDPEFLMLVHLDSLLAHGACSLAVHSSLEFMHHASVFSSYDFLLMVVAHLSSHWFSAVSMHRSKSGHWDMPPDSAWGSQYLRYRCNLNYCNESRTWSGTLFFSHCVMSLASLCVPSLQKIPSICTLGFSCRQRLCLCIRILLHTVLVHRIPALLCTTLTSTGHIRSTGIKVLLGSRQYW